MADWRFAKKSGPLTWITADIPEGMELCSELSPTLLTGQQEEGDSLPVEYVKMQHVSRVEQRGSRIVLHRTVGGPVTLVALTEAEATEWARAIELTIADEKPSSVKPTRAAPPVAAPPPVAAAPVQPMTSLPPRTISPNPQVAAAAAASRTTPPLTGATYGSRPYGADQVEQQQPSQVPSNNSSSFVPVSSLSVAQGIRSRQGSGARTPSQVAQSGYTPPNHSLPLYEPIPQRAMASQPPIGTNLSAQSQLPPPRNCEEEHHSFRPLTDITRGANAQTTTVTTYVDPVRPANTSNVSAKPMGLDSTPQGSRANQYGPSPAASRPLPSRAYQSIGGSLEPGTGVSPIPARASLGREHSAPYGQGLAGAGPQSRYLDQVQPQQGVRTASQPYNQSTDEFDQGPETLRVVARKRSGMMVDVPPNPQLNRNVAPNVSAIWKEWTAPDGILYVSHEPTGTVQRWNAETDEFETLIDGTGDIDAQDMALRPYSGQETAVDISNNVIKNINRYGMNRGPGQDIPNVSSPNVYRTNAVTSPRGQFSPSRRSQLTALVAPRESQSAYHGRRVHHITLSPADEEHSTIEHQIQMLGGGGLRWDPTTGQTIAPEGAQQKGDIGASTLHKQWEHVRRILLQGRYFKKHALRTTTSAFRFVFLTSDNAYVVCVPTSEVLFNVSQDPRTFGTVAETIQYYGSESRAIALNTITHVSLGSEEQFVRNRSRSLVPENTFCIVSRTHAFVLECNTSEEAKYFADAWTFFLYHSRPTGTTKSKNPSVKNPVTFGTRGGIAF